MLPTAITYALLVSEYYVKLDLEAMIKRAFPDSNLVFASDSVDSAAEFLSETPVDLVVSDVILSDGYSTEMLQAIEWQKPVIFFSEFDELEYLTRSLNCLAFLPKPVTQDNLSSAIQKLDSPISQSIIV